MTDRTCADCDRPVHARGRCNVHYNRWRRLRDPQAEPLLNLSGDIEERFWARVNKTDGGCWLWASSTTEGGYGTFAFAGKRFAAHVWAYERSVGPVPDGLQLDHVCHTRDDSCAGGPGCPHRRCVNPDHLEPVTARENTLRGNSLQAANAVKTYCANGHPFDEANTRVNARGGRMCRACQRVYSARNRAKKRSAINTGENRMTQRIRLDDLTSDQLDALYEQLDKAEQETTATATAAAHLTSLVLDRAERAEAAIARVRALHQCVGVVAAAEFGNPPDCAICGPNCWPCSTIRALDEPAPLTDHEGRTVCTCTVTTRCGCGTSANYKTQGPTP